MAVPQQRRAVTASVAAPIGGWNARDSIAEMNPLDAVVLNNFFPTPSEVMLRKGWTTYSTGITGQVDTLVNYSGPTAQKLFAMAGSKIYDVSTSTATEVYSGLGNDRFQHVNISTSGGNFLVAVNGNDPALLYDGSNWSSYATTTTAVTISTMTAVGTLVTVTTSTAHGLSSGNRITVSGTTPSQYNGSFTITVTGASTFTYVANSAPAGSASPVGTYTVTGITGTTSDKFVNVNLFKERLYFVEENSLNFWYLGVNSIGGAATSYPLGDVARMGGYIQAMGTWTIDAGYGVDDFAVFVTNMGEVIVYKGSNPSDANDWSLVGVWQIGQTFNRRCFFKWGGDLLLLTKDGLVPMSATLQSSRLDPRVNLTDKIYYAISQATGAYSAEFGWQIQFLATANMLILNIPVIGATQQFVMHTITKSWANFSGINTTCMEIFNDQIYFGGDGYVGRFWDGSSDDGQNIKASCQQAYSYFDARGQLKRFTMVRPILFVDNGNPSVLCGISTDFQTVDALSQISYNPALISVGVWDTAIWDDGQWGGDETINKVWQGVTGLGYAGGINLNIASQGINVRWASTDYVMERGGVL